MQEPDIQLGDHQCSGVKRSTPEDPVKNGTCLTTIRHRMVAKMEEFAV